MAIHRRYILTITPIDKDGNQRDKETVIDSRDTPLTIDFNVQRMPFAGQSGATIDIHNLNKTTRDMLFYDWWDINNILAVSLEAGYDDFDGIVKFDLIYRGRIRICTTKHSGTENITHIEALTGLQVFDNPISLAIKDGENLDGENGVGKRIIDQVKTLNTGALNFKQYTFVRPVALLGNAISLIKRYCPDGKKPFIDLDVVYVLGDDEVIEGDVRLINSDTGLIGVPERQQLSVTVKCIFEPRIKVGQVIEIQSKIAPQFDGQYKVWGVSHAGTIGEGTSGNVVTTIQLYVGSQVLGRFKEAKQHWSQYGA